jgi:hypothetical protein
MPVETRPEYGLAQAKVLQERLDPGMQRLAGDWPRTFARF